MFYQDYQKQLNEESINPPIRGSIETEKKTCQNSGYQSPYKGFNRIKLSSTTRFTLRNSINPPIRGSIANNEKTVFYGLCINPPIRGSIEETQKSQEAYTKDSKYQSPYKGFNRSMRKNSSARILGINPPIRGSIG